MDKQGARHVFGADTAETCRSTREVRPLGTYMPGKDSLLPFCMPRHLPIRIIFWFAFLSLQPHGDPEIDVTNHMDLLNLACCWGFDTFF